MKLLTKEEEAAHYRATLLGGALGGTVGLGIGFAGVFLAQKRYPAFRQLTLPLKAFLITSTGTFGGIISADHASRNFEMSRNASDIYLEDKRREDREAAVAGMSFSERALEWGRRERYKIVGGSWILSMVGAFALVGRNPYLTGSQKLVQARVYAQGLTVAVLVASAAFEISEQKKERAAEESGKPIHHEEETDSQKDMWKDMVAAEEERLAERDRAIKAQEEKDRKAHHHKHKKSSEKNTAS